MAREKSTSALEDSGSSRNPWTKGPKPRVLEVLDEVGATHRTGIETIGETRSMADDRAVGKLQHRLRDQSFSAASPHPIPSRTFLAPSVPSTATPSVIRRGAGLES